MIKHKYEYLVFDRDEVVDRFCEITDWECLQYGVWNGKYNKEVSFDLDYYENEFFQHEQDMIYFDSSYDDILPSKEDITKEYIKNNMLTKEEYKGNFVYVIPMGWIIQFLRNIDELPCTHIMLKN